MSVVDFIACCAMTVLIAVWLLVWVVLIVWDIFDFIFKKKGFLFDQYMRIRYSDRRVHNMVKSVLEYTDRVSYTDGKSLYVYEKFYIETFVDHGPITDLHQNVILSDGDYVFCGLIQTDMYTEEVLCVTSNVISRHGVWLLELEKLVKSFEVENGCLPGTSEDTV